MPAPKIWRALCIPQQRLDWDYLNVYSCHCIARKNALQVQLKLYNSFLKRCMPNNYFMYHPSINKCLYETSLDLLAIDKRKQKKSPSIKLKQITKQQLLRFASEHSKV